ncbi:MAG: hypothetical protein IH969_00185, partial [Candidatus Krumholzibacteriota bacterium]|nr:hypothetical protein [Candidatus Krumholzibacteriota bacterium]
MRSLLYALFLIAILVASVFLLRSTEEPDNPSSAQPRPVISSGGLAPMVIDRSELTGASADELYMIADKLLRL